MRTIDDNDYMDWMYKNGFNDDAVEAFGDCLSDFGCLNPFYDPDVRKEMLAVIRNTLKEHHVPENMIPVDFVSECDDGYVWRLPDVD